MIKTKGYAAFSATTPLAPFHFERRAPRPTDIQIEILYCGVCHSDIHTARNEWKGTTYPCVPGHEIVGHVTTVGKSVQRFKKGDLVAVGCMVDSCRMCNNCTDHLEQYCTQGPVYTYNSRDRFDQSITYGGYSNHITVDEAFVLHIPEQFTQELLPQVAPLLCAGITTYSPLKHWKVSKGSKVGIVGLGGLGHMAIKIAHAMGAHVVLFTTSPNKVQDAKRLGAHQVIVSQNPDDLKKHAGSFHLILDTVSVSHNLNPLINLLDRDGALCLLGVPAEEHSAISSSSLITQRKIVTGSLIGGIQETDEMLQFCAKHNITCDIELITINTINEAYERMIKGQVKYRFVIDIQASFQNAL